MRSGSDVVCIRCGLPIGDPPRINRLSDGEPCGACAERLLETLPPIFHAPLPYAIEAGAGIRVEEEQRADWRPDEPA